jgi:hypothetical protein
MRCFKDRTFCATDTCTNKCGRKMTGEEDHQAAKSTLPISYAFFCDVNGEPIKSDTQRAATVEGVGS